MELDNGRCVDGYLFADGEDGNIAREEIKRVNFISGRLDESNPEAVLSVYNKMLDSNTFMTPIGIEYLRTVQQYLYRKSEIPDEKIREIPIAVSYSTFKKQGNLSKNGNRAISVEKKKKVKTFKKEYKVSLMLNLVLFVVIGILYYVLLKSETPNMINYENAIADKYATWEQELTERENVIREKEIELLGD